MRENSRRSTSSSTKCPAVVTCDAGNWCSAAATANSSTSAAIARTTTASPRSSGRGRGPMTESLLDSVVVVLYEPLDPVNIGATVRAMKNMGVHRLRLIRPVVYDVQRIEGIAHGTMDVIQRIERFETFDEAVSDCVYTAAFTARRRSAKIRLVEPREAARELLDAAPDGLVAIIFGREDNGLPNDVLDRVHVTVTIPTTNHASLNL